MSRVLLVLVTAVIAALAIGYAVRSRHPPSVMVASLLPNGTVALAHVPDLAQTRDDWHRSDIYQLYQEPSVQEFLRKPLSRLPHSGGFTEHSKELEALDPKDAFLAVTATENDQPTVVGGFRYRGSQAETEKIVGQWKAKLLGTSATAPETIDYQKTPIQVNRVAHLSFCTAYEQHWCLISNRVEALEATLDRLRGVAKTSDASLATDQSFHEAMAHMPSEYSFAFYLQPKIFVEKLQNLQKSGGQSVTGQQMETLSQVRSFCAATRFDRGKLHDFFFVGMPERTRLGELTRKSIALTTSDTFLYVASLLDLPQQFALTDPSLTSSFLGDRLQRMGRGLAAAGITPAEWEAVFGNEIGAMADWRPDSRTPSPLIAFPVKDFAKAKRMAVSLARILDDDGEWAESDKDGVHYISSPYRMGLVTLQPTIAVSDRFLVAGVDMGAVEAGLKRATSGAPDVSNGSGYKQAVKALPAPTRAFSYLDLGLLYSRLDAAFRPMLLMGAAFMPAMNEYVDVGKLPTAETIMKHLAPIVSSQRYDRDGYAGESIGPITVSQAAMGLTGAVVAGVIGYRNQAPVIAPALLGAPPPRSVPSRPPGGAGQGPFVRPSPTPSPAGTP